MAIAMAHWATYLESRRALIAAGMGDKAVAQLVVWVNPGINGTWRAFLGWRRYTGTPNRTVTVFQRGTIGADGVFAPESNEARQRRNRAETAAWRRQRGAPPRHRREDP